MFYPELQEQVDILVSLVSQQSNKELTRHKQLQQRYDDQQKLVSRSMKTDTSIMQSMVSAFGDLCDIASYGVSSSKAGASAVQPMTAEQAYEQFILIHIMALYHCGQEFGKDLVDIFKQSENDATVKLQVAAKIFSVAIDLLDKRQISNLLIAYIYDRTIASAAVSFASILGTALPESKAVEMFKLKNAFEQHFATKKLARFLEVLEKKEGELKQDKMHSSEFIIPWSFKSSVELPPACMDITEQTSDDDMEWPELPLIPVHTPQQTGGSTAAMPPPPPSALSIATPSVPVAVPVPASSPSINLFGPGGLDQSRLKETGQRDEDGGIKSPSITSEEEIIEDRDGLMGAIARKLREIRERTEVPLEKTDDQVDDDEWDEDFNSEDDCDSSPSFRR